MAKSSTIGPSEHKSVSIREIENGYLTCESGCGPKGEYYSKDTYSPTRPTVTLTVGAKSQTQFKLSNSPRKGNSLAGAVGMLKGKK